MVAKCPNPARQTKQTAATPSRGILALVLAVFVIILRAIQAVGVYAIVTAPVLLAGYGVGGRVGLAMANHLLFPVTCAVFGYLAVVFFLPACFDLVRLCFPGRAISQMPPAQTVGAVNARWDRVRQDLAAIRSIWRARP